LNGADAGTKVDVIVSIIARLDASLASASGGDRPCGRACQAGGYHCKLLAAKEILCAAKVMSGLCEMFHTIIAARFAQTG
jgi:hypothetical protein